MHTAEDQAIHPTVMQFRQEAKGMLLIPTSIIILENCAANTRLCVNLNVD